MVLTTNTAYQANTLPSSPLKIAALSNNPFQFFSNISGNIQSVESKNSKSFPYNFLATSKVQSSKGAIKNNIIYILTPKDSKVNRKELNKFVNEHAKDIEDLKLIELKFDRPEDAYKAIKGKAKIEKTNKGWVLKDSNKTNNHFNIESSKRFPFELAMKKLFAHFKPKLMDYKLDREIERFVYEVNNSNILKKNQSK